MRFSDLKPLSEQRKATMLPDLVREHGMFMMGDPGIPNRSTRIVIGVAPWDLLELDWLDGVAAAALRNPSVTIEIFSTNECQSADQLRERIPGLPDPMAHPPFVGIWRGGVEQQSSMGAAGRKAVLAALGAPCITAAARPNHHTPPPKRLNPARIAAWAGAITGTLTLVLIKSGPWSSSWILVPALPGLLVSLPLFFTDGIEFLLPAANAFGYWVIAELVMSFRERWARRQ